MSATETAYHDVAGAVDYGYHATTKAIEAGYTVASDELRSWINSIPEHISQAVSWDQLRYWAEIALGAESFQVGVCVGMVKNLADSVWGLLKMLKTFVLAGLYEQAHPSSGVVAAISSQTYLIAKAADLLLGAQMKEADQQARALIKELEHLLANPGQLLTALGQQYKQKWDRFWELSKQNTISSKFEAGEIMGDVLMDIIMLIQLAEGAVELASKVPKLLAEAEKLAAEVPEIASAARELGTVKKVESIEEVAKDAETIRDPIQSIKPEVGSSNGVPKVAEEPPVPREEPSLEEKPDLSTNAKKGVFGEAKADAYMDKNGFKKLNGENVQIGDAPKGNGIDGIYKNASPPPEYVIGETKFGESRLGTLKDGTKQMSDEWIDGRLNSELGRTGADAVRDAQARGQVEKWLLQVDDQGNVTKTVLK